MIEPEHPPRDVDRLLDDLETGIAADDPPAALAALAREIETGLGEADPRHRLRHLIASATVDNRLGLSERALATLMEARRLAAAPEGAAFRSTISRMLATLHAWRGRGSAAAGELLRAAAEAAANGSSADFSAALGEAARTAQETHRFDLALIFLDAALASTDLVPTERIRACRIRK